MVFWCLLSNELGLQQGTCDPLENTNEQESNIWADIRVKFIKAVMMINPWNPCVAPNHNVDVDN